LGDEPYFSPSKNPVPPFWKAEGLGTREFVKAELEWASEERGLPF